MTSNSAFTREDKDKLARKRALNPALSGAAAGAAGGALVANVGGNALRNVSQKKVFDDRLNDYTWTDRQGISPRKVKVGRAGSKLAAKALPLTFAAGGIGAVANANGIQMSHLWNKKDKVYQQAAIAKNKLKSKDVSKSSRDLIQAITAGYVTGQIQNYHQLNPQARKKPGFLDDKRVLRGIEIGTALGLAATPALSALLTSPGDDEYIVGVKKSRNDFRTLKEIDRRAALQRKKQRSSAAFALGASGATIPSLLNGGYQDTKDFIGGVRRVARGDGAKTIGRLALKHPIGAVNTGLLVAGAGGMGKFGYHRVREIGYNKAADKRRKKKIMKSAFTREGIYKADKPNRMDRTANVASIFGAAPFSAVRSASRTQEGDRVGGFFKPVIGSAVGGNAASLASRLATKNPTARTLASLGGMIAGGQLGVNWASKKYLPNGNRKLLLRSGYLKGDPAKVNKSIFSRD